MIDWKAPETTFDSPDMDQAGGDSSRLVCAQVRVVVKTAPDVTGTHSTDQGESQ